MKHYLKIFFITFFIGCSSLTHVGEIPSWVHDPSSLLKKDDIFGVGNGSTLDTAKQQARVEILKYFETEISSSFTGNLSATEDFSNKQISEEIKEQTSGLLQGVNIIRSCKTKDGYYVLAVLDKVKSQTVLKHEISLLDAKLKNLINEKPFNTLLFNEYYKERESLNKKYMLISGTEIKLDIPDDLIPKSYLIERDGKTKRASIGKITIALLPKNDDLQTALEAHLAELGYILNTRGKIVVLELKTENCEEISKIWNCEQEAQVTFKKRIIPYKVKGIGKTKEDAHKQLQKQVILKFPQDL